jgi:hypothetical protein
LTYPYIDHSWPGLEVVNDEPPVYVASGVLNQKECTALIAAAEKGVLQPVSYNDAVLFDNQRLLPLLLVVLGGCIPDLIHLYSDHNNPTMQQLILSALHGMGIWAGIAGLLALVIKMVVQQSIQGKVFTGQKWSLATAPAPAAAATANFLQQLSAILRIPVTHLELPTLTR